MTKPHNPSREAHELSPTARWYEQRDGVHVVQVAKVHGAHVATLRVTIPWDELLEAAIRLGKVKRS